MASNANNRHKDPSFGGIGAQFENDPRNRAEFDPHELARELDRSSHTEKPNKGNNARHEAISDTRHSKPRDHFENLDREDFKTERTRKPEGGADRDPGHRLQAQAYDGSWDDIKRVLSAKKSETTHRGARRWHKSTSSNAATIGSSQRIGMAEDALSEIVHGVAGPATAGSGERDRY